MIPGPGAADAQGVYHLGEADNPDGTFSGLMQLVTEPISDQFAADRVKIAALEAQIVEWTTYTPATTNITLGTGTTKAGRSHVVDGECTAEIDVQLGTGASMGTAPTFALPHNVNAAYLADAPLGDGLALVAGTNYFVTVLRNGTDPDKCQAYLRTTGGAYESLAVISNAVPGAWGTTGRLQLRLRYKVA